MSLKVISFPDWLHTLTILAYNHHTVIETAHRNRIESLYRDGKTPQQALIEYQQYKNNLLYRSLHEN